MRPAQLIGPIALIVIGTIFLADNLMFDISFGYLISRFWPVAIIVAGALQLAGALDSLDAGRRWGRLTGGVMTLTVGILLQLQRMDIANFGHTWPALLIVAGGLGLLRGFAGPSLPTGRMRGGYFR